VRPIAPVVALLALLLLPRTAPAAEERLVEDFDATWQAGRWAFSNGQEFPGAKGAFERSADAAHGGQSGGKLSFDFSGGGAYVAAVLRLDNAPEIAAVRLWIKKPRGNHLTFRYSDGTGQTVQRGFLAPDDKWAEVLIPMTGWTGHWGGANDGRLHGPPKMIAFLVENNGQLQGAVLLDDMRIIAGKPEEGAGMITSEHAAVRFSPEEQWCLQVHGGGAGETKLDGRTWRFDFTKGAKSIGTSPREFSILGMPKEFRIRARGKAPAHPVRVTLATHFMTFEKTVGLFADAADGTCELVFQAPPGEGWTWHGGENDGKIHGPLRPRGIFLDAADRSDAGELELLDVRVKTQCALDRACVLLAERKETEDGGEFVAAVRSLAPKEMEGTMVWTIRDWGGKTLKEGSAKVTIPAAGEPVQVRAALPAAGHKFLEAEFTLDAPGQVIPPAQAYHTAPIEPHGSVQLDPASPFGMGLYLCRYPGNEAGLKEMDRAARIAQEAGVKWSREDFGWGRIETAKGKFDWTFYDALVATARRRGISLYGLLGYWPGWTKPYTPEGIEDYCRFAAVAAERYKGDIRHWEVWNEPNIFFWQGPRDMYADLLKQAYAAIKKANPQALVLGCSTAGIDSKFIKRTMELGAPFDILTIHPYRTTLSDGQFIDDLKKVADLAKRPDGTVREAWITEMGWGTYAAHNGPAQDFQVTTQRDQARLLARAYLDAIASSVSPNISWYDFRNDGDDPFNFEHNMGIVTRDFSPKPAYRAFATMTQALQGKRIDKILDLGKDVVAYRFADAAGKNAVIAVWGLREDRDVSIPVSTNRAVGIVDLMGNRTSLMPKDGKLAVSAKAETPAFVLMPE